MGWVLIMAALAVAVGTVAAWWQLGAGYDVSSRLPVVYDRSAGDESARSIHEGVLTPGSGVAGTQAGDWPQFRGPTHDNIVPAEMVGSLADEWPAAGPTVRWAVDVGEGYAGAAIHDGRVYLTDYDMAEQMDVLRCLSLDDGQEIWRYAYPVKVKRNHGMSRTVPAVTDRYVVSLGPKCHLLVCDAKTGEKLWMIDMVEAYGTKVPPWYAGQCPLIDGEHLILAPAGPDVLMKSIDLATGKTRWQTPNPFGWQMSHASVVPMTLPDGQRSYVYVAAGGVVAVAADTGTMLWWTDAWRIKVATVPSAVPVGDDHVLLAGGYGAGAMMLKLVEVEQTTDVAAATGGPVHTPASNPTDGDAISVETDPSPTYRAEVAWQVNQRVFGSGQQTPIYAQGHIFGVRPNGELACLNRNGDVVWTSGRDQRFGLGPYLVAGDRLFVLDDFGQLTMARLNKRGFEVMATARVLDGHDAWGPMAYAQGLLLVRDLTELRCIDLRER